MKEYRKLSWIVTMEVPIISKNRIDVGSSNILSMLLPFIFPQMAARSLCLTLAPSSFLYCKVPEGLHELDP